MSPDNQKAPAFETDRPPHWEQMQALVLTTRADLLAPLNHADAVARNACRTLRGAASSTSCPNLSQGLSAACALCRLHLENAGLADVLQK